MYKSNLINDMACLYMLPNKVSYETHFLQYILEGPNAITHITIEVVVVNH